MNVSRARLHLGIAAAGTLAAAVLVPGIASADPADSARLVNSTCSFAQIDAAMHDVTPQLAARLDQAPERKAQLADFFSKSPADRQAVLDAHPQLKSRLETVPTEGPAVEWRAKALTIAETCGNY
ncbi:hemophore-related protein [Rhodococcus pseudokoreensis]|uniref:Hemophore-related protein n=1 Tax=Rhodococcus pseudokoreensis TaxID=2811421 RepID=A0A974W621_9NOCA|nr:hemophore-related protein [Rhodococcus pseudokoreensis]QSE91370.1 hemophore-related protein [Rhodococcus pseudokoreensis]